MTNCALVLGNSCVLRLQSPRSLGCMSEGERAVLRLVNGGGPSPVKEPRDAHLTIADVAKACGLPQPVIAQLVPRTWTDAGWMYSPAQLQAAVEIADAMRSAGDDD
ncbi:MAG: hypothetical protein QOJ56_2807 [Mycobacterium sp.]|nr:hypothetical protein [Mycobacterium sp.]MDT5354275.1 hypothetical protein [Mycobacterium sp.]